MQIDKNSKRNFKGSVNILLVMQHCFAIKAKLLCPFSAKSALMSAEFLDFENFARFIQQELHNLNDKYHQIHMYITFVFFFSCFNLLHYS